MSATSPTPTFRPFDRHDMACYAGVESKNPLIAILPSIADKWEMVLILDDKVLELDLNGEHPDHQFVSQLVSPTCSVAKIMGESLHLRLLEYIATLNEMPEFEDIHSKLIEITEDLGMERLA